MRKNSFAARREKWQIGNYLPQAFVSVSVISVLNISATVMEELRGVVLCCFVRTSEAKT